MDPGLIAEAERLIESQRPRALSSEQELPQSEPSRDSGESAKAEGESAEGESAEGESPEAIDLSFEEAERFANAFRASWEPSAPAPSAAPAPVYVPAAAAPEAAQPVHAPVLISDLPGANQRRTIMLASAAVAGFLAILLLGWLASRSGAPDHPATDNPLANTAPQAPSAPKLEAAPATVPEPVQAVEPPASAPAPEAVAPAQPVEAPAEAAPPAVDPPPARPEPVLVALQITAQPAQARLTLDGSPISNPYDALHPQGGSHVVEASAPGYQARNLKVELTKKRSVALELQRERTTEPAAAPRAVKKAEKRPKPHADKPAKKSTTFVEDSPY